jgi:hypothetical protein
MPKQPANYGKQWTSAQDKQLKKLIKENTPTRVMGIKLERTPEGRTAACERPWAEHEADEPEPGQAAHEVVGEQRRHESAWPSA